jgi:hypothetical protein
MTEKFKLKKDTVLDQQSKAMANDVVYLFMTADAAAELDNAGPAGIRFVVLGEAAVPALVRLLDNAGTPLIYDGSKEATVGNADHYRVKDFAAFYLSACAASP